MNQSRTNLASLLNDIHFYMEIENGSRLVKDQLLISQLDRMTYINDVIDEVCSFIPDHLKPDPAGALRGTIINAVARMAGESLVVGIKEVADLFFASYKNDNRAFLINQPKVAEKFAGFRFVPADDDVIRTQAHLIIDDKPQDLLNLMRPEPKIIFVNVDEAPADWQTYLEKYHDACAGAIVFGEADAIENLTRPPNGKFSSTAALQILSPFEKAPNYRIMYIPPRSHFRTAPIIAPPSRIFETCSDANLSTTYRFPHQRRLNEIADASSLITTERVTRIYDPVYFGGTIPELADALRVHTAAQILPARYALEFHDIRVAGDGIFFTRDGYFFDGYYFDRRNPDDLIRFSQTYWNVPLRVQDNGAVRCDRSEQIGRRVSGRSIVVPAPSAAFELFAHFALDFMPRIQLAREIWQRGDKLFVSSHIRPRQLRAIVDVFGFEGSEIETYDRYGPATLFEKAVLLPGAWKLESATRDNAEAYHRAMSGARFPSGENRENWKKIFTSRRDTRFSNPRLMLNLDNVSTHLKTRGFREVIMSEYSFAEQMAIFNNAQFIVGELGSSMQPIGCCSPNVKLLWLFGDRAVEYYTYFIAHYSTAVQAKYAMVGCEQFGWPYNSHFIVDLDVVDQALDKLGA